MKKIYLFAALAAMLAACSENDLTKESPQTQSTVEEGAVSFDAYTQRPVTRAGQTGVLKIDNLKKTPAEGGGFGVFGYYTDNSYYMPTRIPDFMYNQLVEWQTDKWIYSPIKYWPNEYGDNAISDDNDRVTFFAYAPYVATTTTGKVVDKDDDSWGITGMSRNSATGDPLVRYIASFEEKESVDLLWGVCDDVNWQLVNTGSIQQTINEGIKGLPWKDVQRPQGIDQRMKFTFKHALTQLSVFVDAAVDDFTSKNIDLDSNTKIYVRSVSFTGVTLKGTLNLNNVDPNVALWLDYNGIAELTSAEPITIYDGLKDGKEGTTGAKATNEKNTGMNPAIISNVGNTSKGVVAATAANGGKGQEIFAYTPVMLIPTGEEMEVEIVYDVETKDSKLATLLSDGKTAGSSIENRIKKTVSFGENGLENGKHYTLNLHLGMNSVRFEAAVSDWQESYEVRDADLPANMPAFLAQAESATPTIVEISGNNQDYVFAVTGLEPKESVIAAVIGSDNDAIKGITPEVNSTADFTTTDGKANANGIAYVKLEGVKNTTVRDLVHKNILKVQGSSSTQAVQLQFDQKASPYQLRINNVDGSGANDVIKLESTNTITLDDESWKAGAAYNNGFADETEAINVKKNGDATAFTWDGTNRTITVTGHLEPGDIVEITFDNGEAPAETVVAKIGGLKFVPDERTLVYSAKPYDALLPAIYGEPGAITWAPTATGDVVAYVDTSDENKIVTGKRGNINIVATCTKDNTPGAEWFYTTTSLTSKYKLTVTTQETVTSFTHASPSPKLNQDYAVGSEIFTNEAIVKGKDTDEAVSTTITYTVVSAMNGSTDEKDKFEVVTVSGTPDINGVLRVKTELAHNTKYVIKVKATAAAVPNKFYTSDATYEITVTTKN